MDASIRQLLAASNAIGVEEESRNLLIQAYKLLDAANKESGQSEDTTPCGSDLYVIGAETALKLQEIKIAEGALQMYFQGTPLTDQFLCRAYLCKAQLLSGKSPNSSSDLDSAVVFLLKAINFAKDKTRYHFIVYNASVLFWQMARPFLRPGFRGLLHQSLQQIVKALNDIDDPDYDWRATLMIALVESLVDAGKTKEAVTASETAADFTLKYAKLRFKDIFRLQIQHKLVEQSKLSKSVNSIPEFLAFLKLQKLKRNVKNSQDNNFGKELPLLVNLVSQIRSKSPGSPVSSLRKDESSTDSMSRVSSVSPVRERRRSRAMSKASLDIPTDLVTEMGRDLLPELLLETARFCADYDEVKLARRCISSLENVEEKEAGTDLEIECLKCVLLVKDLGDMQEVYTQPSVDVRLFAIKRMDQNIQNASRSGNPHVVQAACVTQWNLCLPLLQTNLRKHVRRPLTLVAQSLEDIASLEIQLRCQIHTELAKCEEDVEQVEAALRHIRKALQLDQSGLYHQRLHTMLRRLELSTQLYQSPETPEDTAAVIIEQARKSADSGSIRMKRSLLVKAGLALAPDAFQYVLDSEGEVKVAGQKTLSTVELLSATASQWQKCVRKAAGHLKRLGDENDRERARLWADLAKVARGQEVWDVCRVAARFCLLYDDSRWENSRSSPDQPQVFASSVPTSAEAPKSQEATSDVAATGQNNVGVTSSTDPTERTHLHDTDLLRMLAEVHFINGEALIHLLQCQGLQLNQIPRYPENAHQRPKSSAGLKTADIDQDWTTYVEWTKLLGNTSTRSFLRAIELGVKLGEAWIVCSGTAYLWNYNKHLIVEGKLSPLIEVFEAALNGLRTVGHSSETVLLVRVCTVLSQGLLRPWIVTKEASDVSADPSPDAASSKPPSRKKTPGKEKPSTAGGTASVDPDSQDDLKKALEISEFALETTRGTTKKDKIPTAVRHELIATWVLLKQMLQQQIGTGLGVENEITPAQRDMTKALVILEMHTFNRNGMMEFTVPSLEEAVEITESCEWDDSSIELEVWSRLAFLAHCSKEHTLVIKCAKKGMAFETNVVKKSRKKTSSKNVATSDYEMLSNVSCILGESIMATVTSNPYARRQAMDAFAASARFADCAGNYGLVISACSWWWNASLPLMSSSIERELLRQPLSNLLHYITATAAKMRLSIEQQEKEDAASKAVRSQPIEKAPADQDSHNSLRAAMYGILFQTYTDKGQWEEALNSMDQAIQHMPRTKHRLPIFKNRIMVKAKLGRSVYADIAKFREESEEYVAHMWHRVAVSSHEQLQQIQSYQKAIESLHSDENSWTKVEYLAELSTWLYCNEYPISDSVNVLEWAVDILLGMKFEVLKEEKPVPNKGKKKLAAKATKTPASRGSAKTRESKRSVKIDAKVKPETADEAKSARKKTADEAKENQEEVIPIEKEVIIGLETANLDLKVNDLISVRQLEGLIRTHAMLATISGRGSEKHKSYTFLALAYVMRLWEIALGAAGPLVSQLPKIEENGTQKGGNPPATKEKSQKKGSLEALPQDISEWANYTTPSDILRAFTFNQSDTAVSSKTITKPALTIHYLDELVKELCFLGYDHMAMPVLCFADVIVLGILQSETWSHLICLRKIKLCYELGLVESAKKWEANVGDDFLPVEEKASFLIEHELKLQHAKQVQHEEARVTGKPVSKEGGDNSSSLSSHISDPINLQGRKIKGVPMRWLWMEKAAVLLDLGYHQRARELLNQSMESAIAFEDQNLLGDIYLGMSQLAIQESNLGQAFRFLKLAQDIGGDENFWCKVVLMLVDAIVLDPDVTSLRKKQAIMLMQSAIQTMDILKETRPTKMSKLTYMTSTFSSYSALMNFERKLNENASVEKMMHTNLSKLDSSEKSLSSYGYLRESARLYRKHAFICLELFKRNEDAMEKHSLLLNGLEKLELGVEILQSLYYEVSSSFDLNNNANVSLPVSRELSGILLDLSEYLLQLYDIDAKEQILAQKQKAKSGSLEHIVNEYIGTERNMSCLEIEWKELCALLPQKLFSAHLSSYTFSNGLPESRAKCLYLIGRSLRLLGLYSTENIDAKWSVFAYNITAEIQKENLPQEEPDIVDESIETSGIDHENIERTSSKSSIGSTLTTKQKKKLAENAKRIILGEDRSKTLSCHAVEILMQCVKVGLELKLISLVKDASLEIVEAIGQLDPQTASLFLALHQSAKTSLTMHDFLIKSQPDPSTSQFSSLLHQASWTSKECIHMKTSSIYSWIQDSLQNFTAWKRLSIPQNALDVLKDFPSNFNFVSIQHSPDKKHLYASILDKPKSATSTSDAKGKAKDKTPSGGAESQSYIIRADVNPDVLDDLKERMEEYGMHLMSFLLQSEYQRAQLAMRQKMLQQLSLGQENPHETISETVLAEQEEEEMRIMDTFHDIVESLESYLISFTTMIKERLIDPIAKECTKQIESGQPADVNAMETIILLVDEDLMNLPLEALSCFQTPYIDCLCRDFSLQMSHHRWHVDPEEAAALAEKKKNEPAPKANPKTPKTGKDTRKTPAAGGGKVVPLNREVLPGCGTINTNYVHHMVDPLDETAETEEYKPMQIFNQMLQTYSTSCTSSWTGWSGSSGVPSLGQWENVIHGCEAFIFYGMERFLAHIPPSKVAAFDLSGCQMAMLLDKAQTSKSFRHQSKVDVDKSDSLLSLEKPLNTIMLLSLVGINSVCSNLWHSTLEDNANKLQCVTQVLLEDGQVLGKAVRKMLNPTLVKAVPPEPEPPSTAPAGKDKVPEGKGGKSVKGKDSKKGKSPPASPMELPPTPEVSESPDATEDEKVEEVHVEEPVQASWCNMILFGLPNVMVV